MVTEGKAREEARYVEGRGLEGGGVREENVGGKLRANLIKEHLKELALPTPVA